MRRRILSLVMSVVLAFSMVSATALTAFADSLGAASLGAQATSGKVVYDDVYGVFGGEYALMYKDVVAATAYQAGSAVTDVVKADGTVTIHTSDSSANDFGGAADYSMINVGPGSNSAKFGFVGLSSRSTGKKGIKKLDGTDIVPINYDVVRSPSQDNDEFKPGDDFVALTFGATSAQAAFFSRDGVDEGSLTMHNTDTTFSGTSEYSYATINSYREYIKITGEVSPRYRFEQIAKKVGSRFESVSDIVNIFDSHGDELLYMKSDGKVYFSASRGAEIVIPATDHASYGVIRQNGVQIYGNGTQCFDKAGYSISDDKIGDYYPSSFSNPDLVLADATAVKTSSGAAGNNVTDAQGNAIVRNGYTLSIDRSGRMGQYNSVKHGNADVWWAKDASGNWGAVDSYGNVKVPFQFAGYYDGGATDTDYALVKQDGEWRFVDVKTGKLVAEAKTSIASAAFSGLSAQTYTGAALTPVPDVSLAGKALRNGVDYTLAYTNNVNAGTATVTATGIGDYEGQASATFTINKAANPMKVKAKVKTKKLKAKTLVKKAKSFAAIKFTKKAVGKVTYKSASSKKVAKKFKVNKKTGKVTAKKGTKAGTYKVKVKVKAAGDANRKSASKTITVKVKVK